MENKSDSLLSFEEREREIMEAEKENIPPSDTAVRYTDTVVGKLSSGRTNILTAKMSDKENQQLSSLNRPMPGIIYSEYLRNMRKLIMFLHFVLDVRDFDQREVYIDGHDIVNASKQRVSSLTMFVADEEMIDIVYAFRDANPAYVWTYEPGYLRVRIKHFLKVLDSIASKYVNNDDDVLWYRYYLQDVEYSSEFMCRIKIGEPDNRCYVRLSGTSTRPIWRLYCSLADGGTARIKPDTDILLTRLTLPTKLHESYIRIGDTAMQHKSRCSRDRFPKNDINNLSFFQVAAPCSGPLYTTLLLKRIKFYYLDKLNEKQELERLKRLHTKNIQQDTYCDMYFDSCFVLNLYEHYMEFVPVNQDQEYCLKNEKLPFYLIGLELPFDWPVNETKHFKMMDFMSLHEIKTC